MDKQEEKREQLRQARISRDVEKTLTHTSNLHEQVKRIEEHWKKNGGRRDADHAQ